MLSNKLRAASKTAVVQPVGQVAFTTPGTYSWTVPARVTSVCVVAVGAGGIGGGGPNASGGGGGGLHWRNAISVTPGEILTITVGSGSAGYGNSAIERSSTYLVRATYGSNGSNTQNQGSYPGEWINMGSGKEGGGGGGAGGGVSSGGASGGGGAGGYSGSGGYTTRTTSGPGYGGGGGGGAPATTLGYSGYGGGVGVFGEGASGAAGGGAGSGGSGSTYGGGGSALRTSGARSVGSAGGNGAVRIIWGPGRAFPSTLTADQPVVAG